MNCTRVILTTSNSFRDTFQCQMMSVNTNSVYKKRNQDSPSQLILGLGNTNFNNHENRYISSNDNRIISDF